MARLRLAPVVYKVCPTTDCGTPYEGLQCPLCRQSFHPENVRRVIYDRLILVDVDPSIYERDWHYRCIVCKNLYEIVESDIVAHARCAQCDKPLFSAAQLQRLWKGTETLLQRANKLHRERGRLAQCPHCQGPVPAVCWCPWCRSHLFGPNVAVRPPQNPTMVWVRTFQVAESLEELQQREWLVIAGMGGGAEQALEEEIDTEEEDDDATEHHT